ncbi:MAG: hypothetical protein JW860_12895, partial [Sedimentisphaerales bacterium]|nr:hypothetical protein [Sedimentisphaerales bacterium]
MNAPNNRKSEVQGTPAMYPPPVPATLNPLQILVKRRWQLFACLLLVCSVAFASMFLTKLKYVAVAQVRVVADQSQQDGRWAAIINGVSQGQADDYFRTQCELVSSREVLGQVAKQMGIIESGQADYDIVDTLRAQIKAKPVAGSRIIEIVAVSNNGPEAAALANQTMAVFVEKSADMREETNQRVMERIESQINDLDQDIARQEGIIHAFRQEHMITGMDRSLVTVENRIGQLEQELSQMPIKMMALESECNRLKEMLMTDKGWSQSVENMPEVKSDYQLQTLRQKLDQLRRDEVRLLQTYLPGHSKLQDVRLQSINLQTEIIERTRKIIELAYEESLKNIASLSDQKQTLETVLSQYKMQGVDLTKRHHHYEKLLADMDLAQRFRDDYVRQLRQYSLTEKMIKAPVVVVEAARIPTVPVGLSKSRRAGTILLLGLLFSVAFILVTDRLSVTGYRAQVPTTPMAFGVPQFGTPWGPWPAPGMVWPNQGYYAYPGNMTSPAEVMEKPEKREKPAASKEPVPQHTSAVLGRINSIELGGSSREKLAFAARCRIVHTDQRCSQAETFREVGTVLLRRFGDTQQSLVVTSMERGSGKTTCASNLAL